MDSATTQTPCRDAPAVGSTWALVISTYNREKILPRAIACGVNQDPPPAEVVVVDASDYWHKTREQVQRVIEQEGYTGKVVYEPAKVRSLTAQRNQSIAIAQSDILFLIDDDSLMYPGCARHVLDVFDHPDAGSVSGVCTSLLPLPPDTSGPSASSTAGPRDAENDPSPSPAGPASKPRMTRRLINWLRGEYMPDYDQPLPAWEIPESLRSAFGCYPRRRVHGCRMVFRRAAVTQERFEESLCRYAYLEDTDLGFRVGRHGMILGAPKAKLCHVEFQTGRLPTRKTAIISITNAAFLTRKNAADPAKNLRQLRNFALRRSVLELVKDLARRQWKLPTFIGIYIGLRQLGWIKTTPIDQLDQQYKQFQERLLMDH